MTKEYIEREAAVAALKSLPFQWDVEDLAVYEAIEEVPTADVAPVVHGEWKFVKTDENDMTVVQCSNCGINRYGTPIYCSRCGAKMDGGNSNG